MVDLGILYLIFEFGLILPALAVLTELIAQFISGISSSFIATIFSFVIITLTFFASPLLTVALLGFISYGSIGKLALGLKVYPSNGQHFGRLQAAIREVYRMLELFCLPIALMSLYNMTQGKLSTTEMLTHTQVLPKRVFA